MLRLLADGYSNNLMWLFHYEGRLASPPTTISAADVKDITSRCNAMASALEKEAPASARSLKSVVQNLESGTTNRALQQLLDRVRTSLSAELAQRSMILLMPGETLPTNPTQSPPEPPSKAKKTGGRPSGKHGEPIARITIRLIGQTDKQRAATTAASLANDLIDEYRALDLPPPSLDNAERDAAGILRAVRK